MKKWNGKKRIGRKARAMRAGLRALPPGLYAFQIDAVRMMESMGKLTITYRTLGKSLRVLAKKNLNAQYGKFSSTVKL